MRGGSTVSPSLFSCMKVHLSAADAAGISACWFMHSAPCLPGHHSCKPSRSCAYSLFSCVWGCYRRASASAPAKPCLQPGRASSWQVCRHVAAGIASYLTVHPSLTLSAKRIERALKVTRMCFLRRGAASPAFCLQVGICGRTPTAHLQFLGDKIKHLPAARLPPPPRTCNRVLLAPITSECLPLQSDRVKQLPVLLALYALTAVSCV